MEGYSLRTNESGKTVTGICNCELALAINVDLSNQFTKSGARRQPISLPHTYSLIDA